MQRFHRLAIRSPLFLKRRMVRIQKFDRANGVTAYPAGILLFIHIFSVTDTNYPHSNDIIPDITNKPVRPDSVFP